MAPKKSIDILRFASLGTQFLVSIVVTAWLGVWIDKKLAFTTPIFVWLLPLLTIIGLLVESCKRSFAKIKLMKKGFVPIILVFVIVNGFTIVFRKWLATHGVDEDVVLYSNLLLFVLTMAGYFMYSKAVTTKKGNVMMLNVYGSFILKFFAVAIAMLVYIFMAKQLNRPGLYIGMVLYFLYSFIAIRNVLSLRKRSGNVERKSTI